MVWDDQSLSVSFYLECCVKILHVTQHKIGHFEDVLPSQSLGLLLKKINVRQQKQTTQEQNDPDENRKIHKKLSLKVNNQL